VTELGFNHRYTKVLWCIVWTSEICHEVRFSKNYQNWWACELCTVKYGFV